jgi:glutaredoxin
LSSTTWAWSMNYASGDLLFAKCPDCQKADETLNEVNKDKED